MFNYQLQGSLFKKIKRFVNYFILIFLFFIVNNGNILTDGRRRYIRNESEYFYCILDGNF